MATCTYYAYNAPEYMTIDDYQTMINRRETSLTPLISNISTQGIESVLVFAEPGAA